VAVTGEKGNVYIELVAKCVCVGGGMWQLLWRREMYIWSWWLSVCGECGSYWGEGKCIYGVSG